MFLLTRRTARNGTTVDSTLYRFVKCDWFLILRVYFVIFDTSLFICSDFFFVPYRVVSSLDLGAVEPGFNSQPQRCPVTVLGKLFTPIKSLCSPGIEIGTEKVTAGLAERNGSLLQGLWLMSPAGWLPRTGITSGTLRLAVEYELLLLFTFMYRVRPCLLWSVMTSLVFGAHPKIWRWN